MSKPSYTPGPWDRVDISTGSATKREQLNHFGYAAMKIEHDGSEEGEANARLIAAAPDMAEWIRKVVSYTTAPMADGGIEQEDIDRARALLAEVGE